MFAKINRNRFGLHKTYIVGLDICVPFKLHCIYQSGHLFFFFFFHFFKAHKHCGFHSFHNRNTSVIPETVEIMSTAQYAMRHLVDLEGESHHHTEKCTVARHYTTNSAAGSRRAHMTVTFAHRGSIWSRLELHRQGTLQAYVCAYPSMTCAGRAPVQGARYTACIQGN